MSKGRHQRPRLRTHSPLRPRILPFVLPDSAPVGPPSSDVRPLQNQMLDELEFNDGQHRMRLTSKSIGNFSDFMEMLGVW